MNANRMSFVVFYQGKRVIDKIKNLPVDVSYISKKQNYAILYGDLEQAENLRKKLRAVKGFKFIGPSHMYDKNLNF